MTRYEGVGSVVVVFFIIYYKTTRFKRVISVGGVDFERNKMCNHVLFCGGMTGQIEVWCKRTKGRKVLKIEKYMATFMKLGRRRGGCEEGVCTNQRVKIDNLWSPKSIAWYIIESGILKVCDF